MKNIVVTGASKGIGYETAKYLAKKGHKVFAVARTKENLLKLVNDIDSGDIVPIATDLSTEEGISYIMENMEGVDQIDALINNAGALINKPFFETTLNDWKYLLDVNLISAVALINALNPLFTEGSHIVNIGSMGGFQGSAKFPGLSAYSVSKGALAIFTESLSVELADQGITVNCLCLGAVQTEMLADAFPGYKAPVSPNEMGAYIGNFTLTASDFMNGQIIPVALNNP